MRIPVLNLMKDEVVRGEGVVSSILVNHEKDEVFVAFNTGFTNDHSKTYTRADRVDVLVDMEGSMSR